MLALRCAIFQGGVEAAQAAVNTLSQLLLLNINLVQALAKRSPGVDEEIPDGVKAVFRLHIQFETFIFTDFREEIDRTDDFAELGGVLRAAFERIYAEVDLAQLILAFAAHGDLGPAQTPRKSRASNHWSERGSQGSLSGRAAFGRADSWKRRSPWDSEQQARPEGSPAFDPMTFKKKPQPERAGPAGAPEEPALGEEAFPDAEGVSVKTDSEQEELRRQQAEFRALERPAEAEQKFADVLGFDAQSPSALASR